MWEIETELKISENMSISIGTQNQFSVRLFCSCLCFPVPVFVLSAISVPKTGFLNLFLCFSPPSFMPTFS